MTRNRNRKDQGRQLQRETGTRRAAASRAHDARKQRSQPVQGLLADAADAVTAMNTADAAGLLPAAWQAVCVVGAAAELLAERAGTRDYRGRFRLAGKPLSDAVQAMRAVPVLRSASAEVNPAGSPASRLTGSDAEEIRAGILATCDARAGALGRVPPGIRPPSVARACRAAARSARLISSIYQVPAVPPADDGAAHARPCYLDAGTPAEMGTAIGAHLRELLTADPADTTAALAAAWYGFSLALTLGQFLARRSPDLAVLHENAMPAWAQVIDALDAAPALPDGVRGLGLDTVPSADPALMVLAHKGILNLALAPNSLLRRSASTPPAPLTAPPLPGARPWLPSWATATPLGSRRSSTRSVGRLEPPSSAPSPATAADDADLPMARRHPPQTPRADISAGLPA